MALLLVVLAATVLTPRAAQSSCPSSFTLPNAAVGCPAPRFSAVDLDGNRVTLSGYRGHPLLINFWATPCTPCQTEMPDVQAALVRHRAQGLHVLEVDWIDQDAAVIRRFLAGLHVNLPTVRDSQARIARAYGAYTGPGLPVTFFINGAGQLKMVYIGQMQPPIIEKGIRAALA